MFLLRPKFPQSLKGALKFVVCYSISCLSLDLSILFHFDALRPSVLALKAKHPA